MRKIERPGRENKTLNGDATSTESNEYLSGLLTDYYKRLLDFAFKHGAFLALALGWVVSSKETQNFFEGSVLGRMAGTGLLLVYAAMYLYWILRQRQRSEKVYRHLIALRFMPHVYFETERISAQFAASLVCLQVVVSVCIAVFVWAL
jgi:hypothetical protein